MTTVTLPLDVLHDLVFGYKEFWGERSLSRTSSEPEPFFPRLIPRQLGEIIQQHNPKDKPLFHVLLYPTHAEVWSNEHWQLSTSRKYHIIHKSDAAKSRENGVQLDAIKRVILAIAPAYGNKGNEDNLTQMARALRHASPDIAKMFPGLSEIIYGK